MEKRNWLPILSSLNKGKQIEYIVLNTNETVYPQYVVNHNVYGDDKKPTGETYQTISKYWVGLCGDTIRFIQTKSIRHRVGTYVKAFPIANVKFVKIKE